MQNDDFFDALVDATDIRPIVTRHEQGAAYMANGASLVAGQPSAFCVVPGPGHAQRRCRAHQRLLVERAACWRSWARSPTTARGRGFGVLHELRRPARRSSRQLTKQAELLDDGESATKQVQAALDALVSGRPRPVSIEVPADRWAHGCCRPWSTAVPTRPTIDPTRSTVPPARCGAPSAR